MAALYSRALARDFLDIDAILASGRYSPITDAAFTEYGARAEDVTGLRHRFAAWRDNLLTS